MAKWFKLSHQQYLGFWLLGLLLFLIQEIPYLIMPFLKLETNPIMHMPESSPALERCEKLLGSLCIALMIFVVHKDAALFSLTSCKEKLFFGMTIGVLILNFFGWLLYFIGCQSLFVMMVFIVLMPPLYYVFIGLWRSNTPMTVTGCMFMVIHFVHVWKNLKLAGL